MGKRFENTYKEREVYEINLKKPHKERDYSKFTKEGLKELERRREIAKRISKSPTPGWAKKLQRIVTWIDDIEDVISTATTALEIATIAVPAIVEVTAPLIAAGEIASTVADLFNAAASLPLGPMGAKRAAGHLLDAVLGRFGGLFKYGENIKRIKNIAELARMSGFKTAVKELHNRRQWIGKFIEASQVSDQFTGVGLCLGPVMGLITDSVFGVVRTIQGKKVYVKDPVWAKLAKMAALEEHPEHAPFYKKGKEYDAPVVALKGLDSASRLLSIPNLEDGEVTLRAMIAANISSQVVNRWIKSQDITDYINLMPKIDADYKTVTRPDTRGVLLDIGVDPDEPVKDPTSVDIDPQKEVDYVVGAISEAPKRVEEINKAYEQDEYTFTLNLLNRSHYMVIPYMFDTTPKQEWKRVLLPDRGVVEIALRHRVLPPENATLQQIDNFIQQAAAFYIANGRYPYQDELQSIAIKTMNGYRKTPPVTIPSRYAALLGISGELETAKLPPLAW